IGSPVELWGPDHDIRPLASACGTIPYELLCGVKRVPVRWSGGQG
ncbi:MAG: Alanine racemase, C-terminal domain, partial [Pseudomonadota bacterium]